jgi:hypothetical protein
MQNELSELLKNGGYKLVKIDSKDPSDSVQTQQITPSVTSPPATTSPTSKNPLLEWLASVLLNSNSDQSLSDPPKKQCLTPIPFQFPTLDELQTWLSTVIGKKPPTESLTPPVTLKEWLTAIIARSMRDGDLPPSNVAPPNPIPSRCAKPDPPPYVSPSPVPSSCPMPVTEKQVTAWLSDVMIQTKKERLDAAKRAGKEQLIDNLSKEQLETLVKMLNSANNLTPADLKKLDDAIARLNEQNDKMDALSKTMNEKSSLLDTKASQFAEEWKRLAKYKFALFTMMKKLQGQCTEGLTVAESEAAWQRFAQSLDNPYDPKCPVPK